MIHSEFSGFSQKAQEFLWGIRLNNERSWFLAHKEQYHAHVTEPLAALGRTVHASLVQEEPALLLHVSRIYRDARRLHGRGPYKEHRWFTLHSPCEGNEGAAVPAFYFELTPDSYGMGMGYYNAEPLTMAKLRARIDRDPKPLEKLVRRLNRQADYVLDGQLYKRPKGAPGTLLSPWYNRRSIAIGREHPWQDEVFHPALADTVAASFRFLLPYYRYLLSLSADPDPRQPQ